jgi:hypothetical protein
MMIISHKSAFNPSNAQAPQERNLEIPTISGGLQSGRPTRQTSYTLCVEADPKKKLDTLEVDMVQPVGF